MKKLTLVLQAFLTAWLLMAPFSAIAGQQPALAKPPPPKKAPAFSTIGVKPVGLHFHIVLRDKNGKVLAVRDPKDLDLVTTVGATQLINDTFGASSFTSAWYMGEIKGSAPTFAVTDTMASHPGWTEEAGTDITNATRPTILPIGSVTVSGNNATAVATAAVFTQNSSITLQGFYIVDNNTVAGTTGNLYGELAFSSFSVAATNTVTITVSIVTTAG